MPKPFRKGLAPFIILMLAVPVLWFIVFYVMININSIIMAFRVIDGIGSDGRLEYVWGLGNFKTFFEEFRINLPSGIQVALKNTMKYFCLNFFLIVPATFFVAYFMYKKIAGYKFFRVLFYSPSIISATAMVIMYKNIIGGYGPLYELMEVFGVRLPALLTDSATATPTILVYCVWVGFGVNIVLYQGAMGRIPEDVIEAGKLDGVGWVREMFQIVTPMIWPTLSTTIILALSKVFTASGPILLFNEAGSALSFKMDTISYFIFRQTYDATTSLNYPAAISVFFTVVSLPFVLLVRWLFGKIDPEVSY